MSQRNKLEAKRLRKNTREVRACEGANREPLSDIPSAVVHQILGEKKVSRRVREGVMASRGNVIQLLVEPKIDLAVKNLHRLTKLTLAQLIRRRAQTARRAATCKWTAEKKTLGSKIRDAWEAAQAAQLAYLKQVVAEISFRTTPRN